MNPTPTMTLIVAKKRIWRGVTFRPFFFSMCFLGDAEYGSIEFLEDDDRCVEVARRIIMNIIILIYFIL